MDAIQRFSNLLDTHRGRDKVIRTLQYSASLIAGCLQNYHGPQSSSSASINKLLDFSKSMGETRTILRLLDDLPTWLRFISGKANDNFIDHLLDTAENVSSLIYYPTEHLAWAADKKFLQIGSEKLWMTTTYLWVFSLSIAIVKSVITFFRVTTQLVTEQPNPTDRVEVTTSRHRKLAYLKKQQWMAIISIIQSLSDLCNAINRLPSGYLWAGKLSNTAKGAFGLLASLLGIYRSLQS